VRDPDPRADDTNPHHPGHGKLLIRRPASARPSHTTPTILGARLLSRKKGHGDQRIDTNPDRCQVPQCGRHTLLWWTLAVDTPHQAPVAPTCSNSWGGCARRTAPPAVSPTAAATMWTHTRSGRTVAGAVAAKRRYIAAIEVSPSRPASAWVAHMGRVSGRRMPAMRAHDQHQGCRSTAPETRFIGQ